MQGIDYAPVQRSARDVGTVEAWLTGADPGILGGCSCRVPAAGELAKSRSAEGDSAGNAADGCSRASGRIQRLGKAEKR